ncbi:MAG TPA: glycosyltransferase, partial [Patescibacteria group bacterium]|nr:glycosyltransferase [Patescibacteria group bacterium]
MGTENIKLRILWLSWKDVHNPLAGGAEVISDALMSRLVKDGHEVRLITAGFPGSKSSDKINGYGVTRVGSRQSVYWQTFRHVRKNLKEWPDLVVEEVNTIPFFSKFYLKKPRVLFFHMLCRQIWFYQMVFPFSLIGYLIEPLYLRLIKQGRVIAMSGSTKQDLMRSGFKARDITVISEGIEIPMLKNLNSVKKFAKPTMLSLGAMRGMKRTDHQIKAFEIAKQSVP